MLNIYNNKKPVNPVITIFNQNLFHTINVIVTIEIDVSLTDLLYE